MKIYIIIAFAILLIPISHAQDSLETALPRIVTFQDFVTIRTGFGRNYNDFGLIDSENNIKFSASPNAENRLTFSLLFRSVELDIGFSPQLLNHAYSSNIKTDLFVLGTRLYLGSWMQSIAYYRTIGFALKDANFYIPEEFNDIYADLNVLKIGGTTGYLFNKNFSFKAITFQNEWQRQSSGSFIPTISYFYTRLKNDTLERNYYYDVTIGPSYYYNWVISENWLLSGGLKTGVGINITTIRNSEYEANKTYSGINYNLGTLLSVGYNSVHFFSGMNLTLDYFEHGSSFNSKIEDRQTFFEIYLGYRFSAPKKLLKMSLWVNEKLGLTD